MAGLVSRPGRGGQGGGATLPRALGPNRRDQRTPRRKTVGANPAASPREAPERRRPRSPRPSACQLRLCVDAQRARSAAKSGTMRASSASLNSALALATKRVQPASKAMRAASRRTRAARWPLSAR